jgi:hypothetical protein
VAYARRSVVFPVDHPLDELEKMRAATEKARELDPLLAEARGFLGYGYARAGHREEAEKMAAASGIPMKALIFAGLGDKERAFDALDRMAVLGPQRVGTYLNVSELAFLRGDLRLKAFRKKVGLPD